VDRWGVAQAERYVAGIRAVWVALGEGALPDRDAGHVRPGLCKAPAGSHMLYFRRRADGAAEILRILHRRMDVDRALG
jgi:toxin ParE1/3/4